MATSSPTTKAGWLALAQHYRDNAADYEGYPHDSWEYSQYTYWIGKAEDAEGQAANFPTNGGGDDPSPSNLASPRPRLSSYSISNETDGANVSGTSGDDSILNRASKVTINAGAGSDEIGRAHV